ncbi:MAG: hypothetical protein U0270_36755 [Labilithrix sp.]
MRWGVALLVLGTSTISMTSMLACAQPPAPEEDYGDSTSNVQTSTLPHYSVATTALTGAVAQAQRATGVLIAPRYLDGALVTASDGTPIRSTCGVTFIDRTHAITAGHCADDVDVPDPPARPLEVELIDVDPTSDWRNATKLTGTFPAYEHAPITKGYSKTTLSCTIIHRCHYGNYECPPQATAADADIMMLECPSGLPADREPVPVAPADAERGAVKAFWFHEIYDAPTAVPAANDAAANDLFDHYSVADPTGQQNFHYFGADKNQLLPLVSNNWSNGAERTRLRREGTVVWTDLFGCHGTSGSGIMQLDARTGRYQLLGPTATASRDWGSARLCTDPATHRQGRASLSYTASEFTRELAALVK